VNNAGNPLKGLIKLDEIKDTQSIEDEVKAFEADL
jgi:hypothetical protein